MRSLLTLPKFLLLSLLLSFGYSASALAVLMSDLYEVILPVADESSEARNAAMADGLAEMLVRQSGDGHILQKLLPPPAGAYVKQYRYEARQPVDPEDPNARQIRLQYNSTRVMDFLRDNGLPIWGDHRSLAVVWLAVRDGSNQVIFRCSRPRSTNCSNNVVCQQSGRPMTNRTRPSSSLPMSGRVSASR
jgi:hypothetical protein